MLYYIEQLNDLKKQAENLQLHIEYLYALFSFYNTKESIAFSQIDSRLNYSMFLIKKSEISINNINKHSQTGPGVIIIKSKIKA